MSPCPVSPDREQILGCLDRILVSHGFRDSPTARRFLQHVVQRKLDGDELSLKEYSIGVEVLHRADDYDPRTDAIVRVQARALRAKLAHYYEEEGRSENWCIELPKGGYVPLFRPREPDAAAARAETAPGHPRPQPRSWWFPAGCFVAGLLLGAAITRFTTAYGRAHSVPDPSAQEFWGHMLAPGASNTLVYGVPQLFTSGGIIVRDVFANDEKSAGERLGGISHLLSGPLEPVQYYTGQGETRGLCAVQEFFLRYGAKTRVISTTNLHWADLKSEDVVVLASLRFQHLLNSLNLPTGFVAAQNEFGVLRNLDPRPGELSEYRNNIKRSSGTDYAVITVWPGKSPDRKIIMVGGMYTYGTQAAAEYIVGTESLRTLSKRLKPATPYYQVLLEVEVHDDQPIATRFITWHDLKVRRP